MVLWVRLRTSRCHTSGLPLTTPFALAINKFILFLSHNTKLTEGHSSQAPVLLRNAHFDFTFLRLLFSHHALDIAQGHCPVLGRVEFCMHFSADWVNTVISPEPSSLLPLLLPYSSGSQFWLLKKERPKSKKCLEWVGKGLWVHMWTLGCRALKETSKESLMVDSLDESLWGVCMCSVHTHFPVFLSTETAQ